MLALSILGAGALIGAGLYFGLRGGSPAPVPPPPSATAAAAATVAAKPASTTTATEPAVLTPEAHRKAVEEATAAVAAQKKAWTSRCWEPALAKTPEPKTSRYLIALSFNKDGALVVSGVSQVRDKPSRLDVVGCLQSALSGFSITPPGAPAALEIPIEFP